MGIKDTNSTLPSTVSPATFSSFLLMLETVNHSPTELLYRSRFFPHTPYQNHNLFHSPTMQHSQIHFTLNSPPCFALAKIQFNLPAIPHCTDSQFCTCQNAIQLACNSSLHRFTILHLPKCNSACLQFLTAQIHKSALAKMQFSLPAIPHCTLPQDAGHPPQCSIGLCFT